MRGRDNFFMAGATGDVVRNTRGLVGEPTETTVIEEVVSAPTTEDPPTDPTTDPTDTGDSRTDTTDTSGVQPLIQQIAPTYLPTGYYNYPYPIVIEDKSDDVLVEEGRQNRFLMTWVVLSLVGLALYHVVSKRA